MKMETKIFSALEFPHVVIPVTFSAAPKKEDIEVFEGADQIDNFRFFNPTTSSIALLIDNSRSMSSEKLGGAINAAKAFVDLCREDDELALVKFSTSIRVMSHFTHEKEELKGMIAFKSGGISTRLYDAIYKSLKLFPKENGYTNLRVIVVLTDGRDNISIHRCGGVIKSAKKKGVLIFSIGFGDSEKFNEKILNRLASETLGEYRHAPNGEALKEIYENIAEKIKNMYFIVYDSPKFADGSEREVLVRTNNPDALELEIKRKYISKLHSSEILWLWHEDVNNSHEGVRV